MINQAFVVFRRMAGAVDSWCAMRRLSGADDAMLADIGVARGHIDWLVHHGRQR
ncbi:MAG: hypothetical protein ACOZAM_07150 [Pseudomonadota bacterium]